MASPQPQIDYSLVHWAIHLADGTQPPQRGCGRMYVFPTTTDEADVTCPDCREYLQKTEDHRGNR